MSFGQIQQTKKLNKIKKLWTEKLNGNLEKLDETFNEVHLLRTFRKTEKHDYGRVIARFLVNPEVGKKKLKRHYL